MFKVMADIERSGLAIIEEARLPVNVSRAWKKYFREHVPASAEEFDGLPHKPAFKLLNQRDTSSTASAVTVSADAIVMPGDQVEGSIERVTSSGHNPPSTVARIQEERRRAVNRAGRDATEGEMALLGQKFKDDGKEWVIAAVAWAIDPGEEAQEGVYQDNVTATGMYVFYHESTKETPRVSTSGGEAAAAGLVDLKSADMEHSSVREVEIWLERTAEGGGAGGAGAAPAANGDWTAAELQRNLSLQALKDLAIQEDVVVTPGDGHMGQRETWANKIFAVRRAANGGAAGGGGAPAPSEAERAVQRAALMAMKMDELKAKGAEEGVQASDVSHAGRKVPWVDAILQKRLQQQ
jgi:hypothetical protein